MMTVMQTTGIHLVQLSKKNYCGDAHELKLERGWFNQETWQQLAFFLPLGVYASL